MKRFVSISLIVLYTAFNMGLVVSTHYCGGKIASVSLFGSQTTKCGICGKKQMSNNCCHDTKTLLSIDDNQMKSSKNAKISNFFSFLVVLPTYYSIQTPESVSLKKYSNQVYVFETSPTKTPLYIQLHSLLI